MDVPGTAVPPAAGGRVVWLRVGILLDGIAPRPVRDAHIVYDARSILHAGATAPPPGLLPGDRTRPDLALPGFTALPGLIDAHAHIVWPGGELDPAKRSAGRTLDPRRLLADAMRRLERLAPLGIAGVRDAGDRYGVGTGLGRLQKYAGRPAPYIDSPGAAIYHRGCYGSFFGEPVEDHTSPAECVRSRIDAGAYRIKLVATGVVDFERGAVVTPPQMDAAEVAEFVRAAREHRMQTFAHASGPAGIDGVIGGGVDSVEHGYFIRDDQLARMAELGIAWVPTFAPVRRQLDHAVTLGLGATAVSHIRRILDAHAESLRKAHRAGVPIVAGSDAGSYGVPHGHGLLHELALMEEAGLPPIAVINSATGLSSARLGFGAKFGRIAPGYLPRFILTRYSPLETVANLRKERTVVFDGEILSADEATADDGL